MNIQRKMASRANLEYLFLHFITTSLNSNKKQYICFHYNRSEKVISINGLVFDFIEDLSEHEIDYLFRLLNREVSSMLNKAMKGLCHIEIQVDYMVGDSVFLFLPQPIVRRSESKEFEKLKGLPFYVIGIN